MRLKTMVPSTRAHEAGQWTGPTSMRPKAQRKELRLRAEMPPPAGLLSAKLLSSSDTMSTGSLAEASAAPEPPVSGDQEHTCRASWLQRRPKRPSPSRHFPSSTCRQDKRPHE
jgi:hypothetical protein